MRVVKNPFAQSVLLLLISAGLLIIPNGSDELVMLAVATGTLALQRIGKGTTDAVRKSQPPK